MNEEISYSKSQLFWLVALRCLVGWHFLYEGVSKLFNSSWSAYPYLMDSKGPFATLFYDMAGNSTLLDIVNFLNVYGLTLVGLGLILGCLSRYAAMGGICFLIMFYLSHPPFIGADYMMPTEGSYLWVDKNLIEIGALMVLIFFPTSKRIGFDRYIYSFFNRKQSKA